MSAETPSPSQPTTELLQRILDAVEPPKRKPGVEIACAVILALTTTASAWCACQSKLWGGAQAARSNAAIRAGREQAVNTLAAFQWRAFDASVFITYGDNGAGLGASHQTGWTGVIARVVHLFATTTAEQVLQFGKAAVAVDAEPPASSRKSARPGSPKR